jgi:mono/diheme cytochrome c family protein
MNDAENRLRDEIEPAVRQGAVHLPMWIVGLLGLLIYWGFNYIDAHGGNYNELVYEPYRSTNELASVIPADEVATQIKRGTLVYGNVCAGCHQPHGGGNAGQAPPLASSEWVISKGVNRLIRIPATGLSGPVKVNGVEWNLSMPALAAQGAMTDEDLAAVLTYIRNSFGNRAGPVTVDDVQNVRKDLKGRLDPYTAEELLKLPEEIK